MLELEIGGLEDNDGRRKDARLCKVLQDSARQRNVAEMAQVEFQVEFKKDQQNVIVLLHLCNVIQVLNVKIRESVKKKIIMRSHINVSVFP